MKNKKILTFFLLLLASLMMFGSFAAFAEEPYQTYTYSADGFALYSPAAYSPVDKISYDKIGLATDFNNPSDLVVDKKGDVYLADPGNNRVIAMHGTDYTLKFEKTEFDNNGYRDKFYNCQGVFVDENYLYVCDTGNNRIVMFDLNGNFVKVIGKPQGKLFGTDTTYRPKAVAVDQYGRIFVISAGTYEGVIVMTSDGEFTGYIGAQKVSISAIELLWRRFQTAEQRKGQAQHLSVEYNNITVDTDGFIYVTTNNIDASSQQAALTSMSADYSPVKKLNSAGTEIMKRNGFFAPGGEVDTQNFTTDDSAPTGPSRIIDVAIGEEGTWSIADSLRSKIFTYDQNGVLLFAFGDTGIQLGCVEEISSVTYQGSKMLILDKKANTFTVYKRTYYGDQLIAALKCENDRKYADAINAWLNVLQYNNNFDSAYIGVGKSYYRQGDASFVSEDGQSYYKQSEVAVYDGDSVVGYTVDGTPDGTPLHIDDEYTKRGYTLAMEYLSAAYDDANWSNAYKEIRKEWIAKWILLIPVVAVILIIAWSKFMKFAGKVNDKVSVMGTGKKKYGQELIYVFHLMFHPFDGFWDLKHERRGSVRAAITILGVLILSFYYQSIGTGYVMNPSGEYSTIIAQVLSIMLPFLLWVIANWCLTTLFEGEGSFKDIFIATSYALSPMPLLLIISTILSNVVTLEESAIVTMLVTIGFVWAGLLIFFGMMVTHDYSFTKNLLMCIVTIVGMAVIMFVGFLFSSLIGKMVSFVSSIATEIGYRV